MGSWQRLRYLPWKELGLCSALTLLCVLVLEGALRLAFQTFPLVRWLLIQAFSAPIVAMCLGFAAYLGLGALAVYLLERVWPQLVLSTGSLWALILCLLVALLLRAFIPVPAFLIGGVDQISMAAVVVGVFWKGRPYWQRY
ncbi:peptide chain release factor 1 [Leptolyngbya sp. FACHB-261]|uniref:peptide chain release factor 1 n=1 Tax=Leptolyngbya sp. FACHB-261 TaxID=2692806 RepID=UPI001686CA35|nr:peptide chain release factor 1 [Leptolyngbya sp. FACHB-261]MBD2102976.1 peptide chain release factor 1 [Leptolyngbya sp. FACHB-261]